MSRPDKARYDGFPESPNFSPPSPLIDRPRLSLRTEAELKRACAVVLQDIKPSDEILNDLPANAYNNPFDNSTKSKSGLDLTYHHKQSSLTAPYVHIPENAASSFQVTATRRENRANKDRYDSGVVFEPLEPAHTKASFTENDEALREIRANLSLRPKTSAAACVDYSADNSSSTTRTHTTYDIDRISGGTPFTSAALTPGEVSKTNVFFEGVEAPVRVIPTELQDEESTITARSWMAQQFAKRRLETSAADSPFATDNRRRPTGLPRSATVPDLRTLETAARPTSRAGSIAEGIKQYIRPRSSVDSMRSYRSVSTTGSTKGDWWRNSSLRRRFSDSSLRNSLGIGSRGRNRQSNEYDADPDLTPDLNRALPPLPGLDKWQDKPRHIAHLMKTATKDFVAKSSPRRVKDNGAVIIEPDGLERIMSKSEQEQRKLDLQRAVMEKMSCGSIGSVPSGPTSPVNVRERSIEATSRSGSRPQTAQSGSGGGAMALNKVNTVAVIEEKGEPEVVENSEKKPTFMKRLGRFGLGGSRRGAKVGKALEVS